LEFQLTHTNEAAALRRGDEAAFDAVFRAHYAPLCRYATGLTDGDPDEAEDLVQQAFVKLWEKRDTLDFNWSVKAYLYKMVHNTALNRLRHQQTKQKYQQYNLALPLENAQEQPQDTLPELRERLQEALNELPPQCRNVFELSRFEELKYREIAELLDISIKTVETQMGKALRLMRLRLADYLVTLVGICVIFLPIM
jgi:RNA polymerase sigma-70 factor, ECF subfamily